MEEAKDAKGRIMPKGKIKMSSRRSPIVKSLKAAKKGAKKMKRKVIIALLGILFFGVITLHALSVFSSFTIGIKEEQYKVLVSDAILALAIVSVLAPLFQMSERVKKLQRASKKTRKLRREVAGVLIAGSNIDIKGNMCFRCGYEWRPKNIDAVTSICKKCKSPYWDRPRRSK
ncbi:MAG: hypothetical protein WAV28_19495 [Sedimentisphaerales bacterium]